MSPSQLSGNPDPNGAGYTSPPLDIDVHPTALNRGAPIIVHSPNAVCAPEHVTAEFENRIRTERKVPKTGMVSAFIGAFGSLTEKSYPRQEATTTHQMRQDLLTTALQAHKEKPPTISRVGWLIEPPLPQPSPSFWELSR
ncbi:hypothetical protein FRC04_001808 [Tulasnella sp. 424]|nr:hypothetical protein FRC04_001808 [Tulasnella sp. 424]